MPRFQLPIINNQLIADIFIINTKEISLKNQPVKALLDTGATQSCIVCNLARELNLQIIGKTEINTAAGITEANKYKLRIGMPFLMENNLRVEAPPEVEVTEIPEQPTFSVILGMDIIRQGILIISGKTYIFGL
ncbi:MAG: retroviral-like aspartic protease family protein [Elusimicrobiota bacterium]|jgi:hypothetical protein|nr:retroviral-like aspartic protease family protein [Elusimicrobiota bacterium]